MRLLHVPADVLKKIGIYGSDKLCHVCKSWDDFLSKECSWLQDRLGSNVEGLPTRAGDEKSAMIENVLKARNALLQEDANALEARANGLMGNQPDSSSVVDAELCYKLTETT